MLQAFRKHAYSVTTRVLLVLLAGVFCIFFGGLGSYFLHVKPVAQVGCYTYFHLFTMPGCTNILPDQVDQEVTDIRKIIQNTYGENAPQVMQSLNLRQIAVEQLVEQTLISREARRLGLRISDEDLAREIESQAAFQTDGHFDVDRYNAILRNNGLEPAAFEDETRGRMLTDLVRQMVSDPVQVSPDEARREFNRFAEKLSLAYIEFPYQNFTAYVHPTDQQVAKFYNENKDMFRESDRIKMVFVRYDPAALAANQTFSDQDIENYYERNLKAMFTHPEQVRVRHILISAPDDATPQQKAAAKTKAEEILQQIKDGADFAKLAKQYSDDPGTKDNGGELPFFSRGEMVKPFEDAAFKLKPGQLTVVQSQYGFHILQVQEIKPAHVDTIEEARPKIVAALRQKAGGEIARQDIEQDIAAAGEGRSLEELARKRGLVAVDTPFFAENEPIKGAEDNPKLAQAAFKMQTGDVRAVTSGSVPYLVKVLDRKPAHIPPFSEIKDLVRQTLVRITAESKAHDAAAAILKQIKSASDFDTVAATNHLEVHTTGDFMRASREIPGVGPLPEVITAAAAVPVLPGVLDEIPENDGNSFIFKVVSRTPPSDEEWKTAGPAFTKQLEQQKRAAAWMNFINDLRRKSYVVVNTDQLGGSSESS